MKLSFEQEDYEWKNWLMNLKYWTVFQDNTGVIIEFLDNGGKTRCVRISTDSFLKFMKVSKPFLNYK